MAKKKNKKNNDAMSTRELLSGFFLIMGFIFVLYSSSLLGFHYFLEWTAPDSSHWDTYPNKCVHKYQVVADSNTENSQENSFSSGVKHDNYHVISSDASQGGI